MAAYVEKCDTYGRKTECAEKTEHAAKCDAYGRKVHMEEKCMLRLHRM